MGNAQTDKQPDRLAQTCSTRHATYLLDGVEGAHPLGPTVRQPAGDLAAAHQPLAAPEVAVLAQHPAGPSKCHRHSEEDRQTDRQVEEEEQPSEHSLPPPLSRLDSSAWGSGPGRG